MACVENIFLEGTAEGVCAFLPQYPSHKPLVWESVRTGTAIGRTDFELGFIQDVKILSPNKVVQVIFKDGTSEKAVCSGEDNFSLEIGISICIAKKILGGTGKYNSVIRKAMKIIENKKKTEEKAEEERKRVLKRKQKREAYLKKRELKKREEQIKIQEEAYYRAMKRIEGEEKKNEK